LERCVNVSKNVMICKKNYFTSSIFEQSPPWHFKAFFFLTFVPLRSGSAHWHLALAMEEEEELEAGCSYDKI
jgi:hypothetical protein